MPRNIVQSMQNLKFWNPALPLISSYLVSPSFLWGKAIFLIFQKAH